MMDKDTLNSVIVVAMQVCKLLQHSRESRIAARGESWRPNDSFAEAVAFLFNMESMSQGDGATPKLLEVIDDAIHAVYCTAHDHTELSAEPPETSAPAGRGGFRN